MRLGLQLGFGWDQACAPGPVSNRRGQLVDLYRSTTSGFEVIRGKDDVMNLQFVTKEKFDLRVFTFSHKED